MLIVVNAQHNDNATLRAGNLKKVIALLAGIAAFFCGSGGLQAADNGLARTPPMGWNSWNLKLGAISATEVKQIADAFVTKGMKDAGYEYLVVDDCWAKSARLFGQPGPGFCLFSPGHQGCGRLRPLEGSEVRDVCLPHDQDLLWKTRELQPRDAGCPAHCLVGHRFSEVRLVWRSEWRAGHSKRCRSGQALHNHA